MELYEYEYEMFFDSKPGEFIQMNGWVPIATDMIKHPERIPHYIEAGLLRKIEKPISVPIDEIKIFTMALKIVGLTGDPAAIDAFLQIKELYDKKGYTIDLYDACKIKAELVAKYGKRHVYYSMDLID